MTPDPSLEFRPWKKRPWLSHLARRPRWAADRFAHSAGPTYYEFRIDKIDFLGVLRVKIWSFSDRVTQNIKQISEKTTSCIYKLMQIRLLIGMAECAGRLGRIKEGEDRRSGPQNS